MLMADLILSRLVQLKGYFDLFCTKIKLNLTPAILNIIFNPQWKLLS